MGFIGSGHRCRFDVGHAEQDTPGSAHLYANQLPERSSTGARRCAASVLHLCSRPLRPRTSTTPGFELQEISPSVERLNETTSEEYEPRPSATSPPPSRLQPLSKNL